MKLFVLVLSLFLGIFLSTAVVFSASFALFNSVSYDCDEHGHCEEICEYGDFKLTPGTANNNNSHCIAVFCSADFTVTVHTCHKEEDPECTYSHNFAKPYPECCNQFCGSIVQLND